MKTLICLLILPATLAVAQAQAVSPDRAFAQCGAVADPNARLACYDAARDQSKAAHWPEFGAAPGAGAQAPPVAVRTPPPDPIRNGKLIAGVAQYSLSPSGRFTVTLDNGEIWRQLDSDDGAAQFKHKGPNVVQISRGFWGSYDLKLNAANIVFKVIRIK